MRFKVLDHSSALEPIVNPVAAYARELRACAFALDVETTDASADAEVIELGVVKAGDGSVVIDEMFRPEKAVQSFARRIHGIGDAMLRDKPGFASRHGELMERLNGSVLLAWNSAQDMRFLAQTCERYELPHVQAEWVCVMRLYQRFKELSKPCKLEDACRAMGVKPGNHRALDDALAAARVLYRMAESAPELEVIAREIGLDAEDAEDADEAAATVADFLRSFEWRASRSATNGRLVIRWVDPDSGAVLDLNRALDLQRARMMSGA